jgi:type I restriction enzyme R subunit
MKTLIEGLFPKERLLSYIRNFVVFEVANEKITKKAARYHQFFAAREAVKRTIEAFRRNDRRIGVIWHTTGSGKSLSMAFLVGMLRQMPELGNPTFVIEVDRNDLDDQLHDQFVAARALLGDIKHAESTAQLRELLRTEGGEIIFTTIEKFRLMGEVGETQHPVLSNRSDIIVIADEAHRSQYGFKEGAARYLAEALPNAKRIGFTGTPISFEGADTVEVFGDLIHTYDIRQSQEDRATVPLFYAPRQIQLHLNRSDVDAALEELAGDMPLDELERRKGKWAALAAAAGSRERIDELARDLLAHFLDRTATLAGKGMIVCMTRANCVRVFDALKALPNCPEMKVVMTSNLAIDPPEWAAAGHATTKRTRDLLKARIVDPDDPLQIVIVCDMWLTGTDIPCLHTLYVDKPMKGHSMIQAISRVNRVFRDKPHGLMVDYIGIGEELRDATARYSQGGGRGEPAPNVEEVARPLFMAELEKVRGVLPSGRNYGAWRRLSLIEIDDLYAFVYGSLAESDERREDFLDAERELSAAFLLVKHLDDCRLFADEVIFCQRARNQLKKIEGRRGRVEQMERAVRDLVDDTLGSAGVVDIFQAAGIERADISILDDEFLQTFKDKPQENLRLKLLEQLIREELARRRTENVARTRAFSQLLEETLRKYHNRLVDAAAVVQTMLQIKKDLDAQDSRARRLNLAPEEMAFYDAIAGNYETLYDEAFLSALIRDVVHVIKGNVKVDWTEPHRDDVKAAIRAAVRLVLRRREVREEDLEPFVLGLMMQAEASFRNWPLAA